MAYKIEKQKQGKNWYYRIEGFSTQTHPYPSLSVNAKTGFITNFHVSEAEQAAALAQLSAFRAAEQNRKAERAWDAVHNEGGSGYNPYRIGTN